MSEMVGKGALTGGGRDNQHEPATGQHENPRQVSMRAEGEA